MHFLLLGDYKSPGLIGRTFFTADCKSAGTPSGLVASRGICNPALKNVLTYLVSADLQSAAKEYAFPFVGGLEIPRF